MPGRIMKEYVVIPEPLYRNKEIFTELFVSKIDTIRIVVATKGKGEEEDEKEVELQKVCTVAQRFMRYGFSLAKTDKSAENEAIMN
jgi:hypothetical protein